jgi:glycosyltransferase involved in cell wall biosynthesis
MRIVLVTNIPPPYRIPIFNRLARWPGIDFHAIFCVQREPNRLWDLPESKFRQHFLRESFLTYRGRYIHHNPDVIPLLLQLKADVIITDGFNPTHLYAYFVARMKNCAHVAMTDGTHSSERSLSLVHRLVRRLVYRGSRSFIAASEDGKRLYHSYGVDDSRCFFSWLCVANERFKPKPDVNRPFDFMYCSRMEPSKDPLFALEVACQTAKRLRRRTSLLFVGSGSLESILREQSKLNAYWVDVRFKGFASQQALPGLYQSAKIFLFPSHADVWGVVANEACASGLPVLLSPHAGVAGELVVDGQNGYVRELNANAWADCAKSLLQNAAQWHEFSQRSLERVRRYNFESAAAGIVDACRCALGYQVHAERSGNADSRDEFGKPGDPAAATVAGAGRAAATVATVMRNR